LECVLLVMVMHSVSSMHRKWLSWSPRSIEGWCCDTRE
jgi:hypothetical protein